MSASKILKPVDEELKCRFEIKYKGRTTIVRYERSTHTRTKMTTEDVRFIIAEAGMFGFRTCDRDYAHTSRYFQDQSEVPPDALQMFRKVLPNYVNRLIPDSKQVHKQPTRHSRREASLPTSMTVREELTALEAREELFRPRRLLHSNDY